MTARESRVELLRLAVEDDAAPVLILGQEGAILAANPAAAGISDSLANEGGALARAIAAAQISGKAELEDGPLPGSLRRLGDRDGPEGERLYLFRAEAGAVPAGGGGLALEAALRRLLVHDLRAILQSVTAQVEELLDTDMPDTAGEERRAAMRERVQAAMGLISRILSTADRAPGHLAEPARVDMADLLSEIVMQARPGAARRGRAVGLDLTGPRVDVLGPVVVLRELAQNMIDNAVKYGEGEVSVRLGRKLVGPGRWALQLEVWQAGQGVSETLLAALRQPAASAGRRLQTYGLEIMRLALGLLGGRWEAERTETASCLRACFTLPESGAAAEDGMAGERSGEEAAGEIGAGSETLTGRSILVVEDDAVSRDWIVSVLRKAGAQVAMAPDAEAALLLLRGAPRRFDIALVDITLPGMDGIALARRLGLLKSLQRPRFTIGLSGHGDAETRAACLDAGMHSVLEKPILSRDLRRFLAALGTRKENAMTAPRRDKTAPAGEAALLSREVAGELEGDLGKEGARAFMLRAVDEAAGVLLAVQRLGYSDETRPLLHSAVGSSGITGLARIEGALRAIQAAKDDAGRHLAARQELEQAVALTRARLTGADGV